MSVEGYTIRQATLSRLSLAEHYVHCWLGDDSCSKPLVLWANAFFSSLEFHIVIDEDVREHNFHLKGRKESTRTIGIDVNFVKRSQK